MTMHLIKNREYSGYISRHDGDLLRDKTNHICNLLEKTKLADDAAVKNPNFQNLHNAHMLKIDLSISQLELLAMVIEILG